MAENLFTVEQPKQLVIEHDGRHEKTRYVDMTTGECLLPPRVVARTVRRYSLVTHDGGQAIYRPVGVETLSWPTDDQRRLFE